MAESVNKQPNHKDTSVVWKNNGSVMHVTLSATNTHAQMLTVLYLQSNPPTAKTNMSVCVCVCLSRHTDWIILEAVNTEIVQTSTTAFLNLHLMKEKHP